jgi:cyclopropane-fatty-acyl-phospholipid synthase
MYHKIIFGHDAPDVLRMLGDEATHEELRILGAFQYVCMQVIFCLLQSSICFNAWPAVLLISETLTIHSDIYLHCDKTLMPWNSSAWSAWNFLGTTSSGVSVTYWLNLL